MTIKTKEIATKEQMAADAVQAYEAARDVFRNRINVLQDTPVLDDEGKDLNAMLTSFSRLMSTAVEQTQRVEDAVSKANGGMSSTTYNLDDARAEIGVRLACLRDASAAGEVSEGAE